MLISDMKMILICYAVTYLANSLQFTIPFLEKKKKITKFKLLAASP